MNIKTSSYETRFRAEVVGPEQRLVEALFKGVQQLVFPTGALSDSIVWAAHSPTLGAGFPDQIGLVLDSALRSCRLTLTQDHIRVMAYLRRVSFASESTIIKRIGMTDISLLLRDLEEHQIVSSRGDCFKLNRKWRRMVQGAVAVEAKVTNWRGAVRQAYRNRSFVNKSFVALPAKLAARICSRQEVCSAGIGVIGIDETGSLKIERCPCVRKPINWFYNFEMMRLASSYI